jgi:hypothetical protein
MFSSRWLSVAYLHGTAQVFAQNRASQELQCKAGGEGARGHYAIATPSCVEVPLPSSSKITNDRSVA